jgi:hypothetical protein
MWYFGRHGGDLELCWSLFRAGPDLKPYAKLAA